ncbi:hypothetical protein EJB05_47717 [Eragrostis curvula]|uniref:Uncharacterized protein n=1 Tax=Eragrostis curvula TaxID=38414 RepID=A0A5J9SZZ2_9POAL|nr:hypothetical protein EJB05_47717 [Eragrostis curvula]
MGKRSGMLVPRRCSGYRRLRDESCNQAHRVIEIVDVVSARVEIMCGRVCILVSAKAKLMSLSEIMMLCDCD